VWCVVWKRVVQKHRVEARLKSAGTSTRSHWDHLRDCSVGGLAQKEMTMLLLVLLLLLLMMIILTKRNTGSRLYPGPVYSVVDVKSAWSMYSSL